MVLLTLRAAPTRRTPTRRARRNPPSRTRSGSGWYGARAAATTRTAAATASSGSGVRSPSASHSTTSPPSAPATTMTTRRRCSMIAPSSQMSPRCPRIQRRAPSITSRAISLPRRPPSPLLHQRPLQLRKPTLSIALRRPYHHRRRIRRARSAFRQERLSVSALALAPVGCWWSTWSTWGSSNGGG